MLLERVAPDTKVYLACGYTDMRMQIDGLASLVINQFQLDPSQNALFLFCGRRRESSPKRWCNFSLFPW